MHTAGPAAPASLRNALLAAWAAVIAVMVAPGLVSRCSDARRALSAVPLESHASVLAANASEAARTAAAAVLLLVILWLAGLRVLRWLDRGAGPSASLRAAVSLPAGFAAASTVLMGLLLVRLWFPAVLAAALLGVLAAACPWRLSRLPLPAVRGPGVRWAALALLLWLPWMLVPETHEDAWTYHLAAPRRWLDLHGLALAWSDVSHHFPLPTELVYAWPLSLGLDAVPKWLNTAVFLSGAGALLAALSAPRPAVALAVLATAAGTAVVPTAKSDGFATGALLAALAWGIATGRRRSVAASAIPAGLIAGIALAAKNTVLLNLAWVPLALAFRRPARRGAWLAAWLAAAAVPLLPWLAKSWFLTGDPVYPGARMIMGLVPAGERWAGTGLAAASIVNEHAAFAWIVPLLLISGTAGPRVAILPLATYLVWFLAFPTVHTPRFAFPSFAAAACLSLAPAGGLEAALAGRWRRAVFVLLACAAAAYRGAEAFGAGGLAGSPFGYLTGAQTREAHVFRGLTGVEEARLFMARNTVSGATLLISEWHQYGMPQPCYTASPDLRKAPSLLLAIVREGSTEAGIARKLKQMRVVRLVYNPVRALNASHSQAALDWTDHEISAWHSFFRRHAVLEHTSENMDFTHGTISVYRISRLAARNAPDPLHLPGVETLFGPALALEYAGDHEGAFLAARDACARMPPTVEYSTTVGMLAFQAHRWKEAMLYYRPSVDRDFVDGENFFLYGLAAFLNGDMREAARVLPKASVVNPHRARAAMEYAARAREELASGKN